ncbi:MAG: dUTP diphosphatase [Candidatus Andersenbacteria bacterium CG10_big_fil_rev_8_21_14_0_10_54_11]|uniref:dUTP diphosphatase n=1 Tax=Candidatus Andersenbacteria bacterium CG10_big_fil_rev_8_21_14_0_10_54_11 TaxID=1974485 RepID=A0A2M6WYY1_9BACT|nr:MAG: dUTP diphosphatase [Candidatus Andersenbacteria bacterium CG10_big_fil_rev_8_21_14_0_10_54_11]
MITFNVRKLTANAKLPVKDNPADAGIDVFTNESYVLRPGEVHAFTTGISVEFPEGYAALIWDRSGLGSKGIHRLAGVIDSGYRGEWKIVLINLSGAPYEVTAGDKIAQCVLQKFEPVEIIETAELAVSARGEKGFGSSGR